MGTYEDFDDQKQFACRVIADHARTTAFAIADGILPGNEGRNYVLRKIMRRAIYHGGEHLGFDGLFFHKVCGFVVGEMKGAFPELAVQREFIEKMVRLEEERFGNTLTVGLQRLEKVTTIYFSSAKEHTIENMTKTGTAAPNEATRLSKTLPSEMGTWRRFWSIKYGAAEDGNPTYEGTYKSVLEAFLSKWAYQIEDPQYLIELIDQVASLYDTFGLPKDLARVVLEEHGFDYSEDVFSNNFDRALARLQQSSGLSQTQQSEKINPIYKALERQGIASIFRGYETTKLEDAKVIAIVKVGERVDELAAGEEGLIVLNETPFYAESGGQVGDRGTLVSSPRVSTGSDDGTLPNGRATDTSQNSFGHVIVLDTFAPIPGITIHKSKVKSGTVKVGDTVAANVDVHKRDAIRRNHTATHLVHAALKEVLGTHVKQAGSVVAPNYLRFDFTHYQAMSDAELKEIEDLVNKYILENEPVSTKEMSIDDAMISGAVAMFGEKYGSAVRVLSVGDGEFSKELCGGTHVRATGDIGSFKITADEAIASGVRRIRAITGFDAFNRFRDDELLIDRSLEVLNTQRDQLPNAIEKLQEELKQKRKEVGELKLKVATGAVSSLSKGGDEARDVNGVKVMAKSVDDLDKGGMRHLSDTLMAQVKSGVVIIGNKTEGKVSFIVRVSDDLTNKIRAGDIIKEIAPIVGGRGGGKPDMAEGGGSEPEKLSEAMDASYGVIEKVLG